MVKHTLPRRLTAFLLAGLVCAASSGLAIHDPDCVHHQHGAVAAAGAAGGPGATSTHHEAGHPGSGDAGSGAEVHLGMGAPGDDAPAGQDCECLGFCALAGQVHATVTTGAGHLRLAATPPTVVGRTMAADRIPGPVPALQPPATGPPALS